MSVSLRGAAPNRLEQFFNARQVGRGIWKWEHYFDIYERHFNKFVGQPVNVLEIGVYSGGSLDMWRDYFGDKCRLFGVDLETDCKVYENDYTQTFIGDQQDRDFWRSFKQQAPAIDIVIDDGGHLTEQQIATLEELLPHLRPGGVYLCEDIHRETNGFGAYVQGLAAGLNAANYDSAESAIPPEFQAWIRSISLYPFVTVIEKAAAPLRHLVSARRGTDWQPFIFPP